MSRLEQFAALEAWIALHLSEDLSVEVLARHCQMSLRSFARVYRAVMHRSPADFVEYARVAAVLRLLEDDSLPIKAVASLVGFRCEASLRRAFLRRLKMTPQAWRQLDAATRPEESVMAGTKIANAYAGNRYIATPETITGVDAGKLLRAHAGAVLTFVTEGWSENQYVDIVCTGDKVARVIAADGINRAGATEFEIAPDRRAQMTFVSLEPPCWCAWTEQFLKLEANEGMAVNAAGDAQEARVDRYALGLDLVLDGDDQGAGYWRAPWPGVLESVAAMTRGGAAAVQIAQGPDFPTVLGFERAVTVTGPDQPEKIILSGQPFAAGSWFHVRATASEDLVADADGVRGILLSLNVVRSGG